MKEQVIMMPILLMVVMLSFCVSADTLIVGIVYNGSMGGDFVGGADVNVTCGVSFSSDVSEVSDGSYSVSFSDAECNSSISYSVEAGKGNYFGNENGNDIDDLFGAVVNVVLSEKVAPIVTQNITINGTIYYNDTANGSVVDGADVTVTCDGNDIVTSSVNGSYSVDFLESSCNDSHVYSVFAVKDEYSGTSGDLNVSAGTIIDVAILKNVVVPVVVPVVKSSSSSSGGGGGWSGCSEGYHVENIGGTKCVLDAVENVTEEDEENFNASGAEEVFEGVLEEDESKGFFSTITGAVAGVGAGTVKNIGIGILFLLILSGLFSLVRSHYKE